MILLGLRKLTFFPGKSSRKCNKLPSTSTESPEKPHKRPQSPSSSPQLQHVPLTPPSPPLLSLLHTFATTPIRTHSQRKLTRHKYPNPFSKPTNPNPRQTPPNQSTQPKLLPPLRSAPILINCPNQSLPPPSTPTPLPSTLYILKSTSPIIYTSPPLSLRDQDASGKYFKTPSPPSSPSPQNLSLPVFTSYYLFLFSLTSTRGIALVI